MADTTTLQVPQQSKKETRPNLNQMIGGTFEDIFETVTGLNRTPDSYETRESITTPIPEYVKKAFTSGSIENFNEAHPKSEEKLIEDQRAAVAEAASILRKSRAESVTQEEIRYEIAGMSEEDRNRRLQLNTSLRKANTEDAYHIAELHRQIMRERSTTKQQENDTKIPSPAKQPSALEGVFEGRQGGQGSGIANLSAQAVG